MLKNLMNVENKIFTRGDCVTKSEFVCLLVHAYTKGSEYLGSDFGHTANICSGSAGFHCVTNPTAVSLHFLQTNF